MWRIGFSRLKDCRAPSSLAVTGKRGGLSFLKSLKKQTVMHQASLLLGRLQILKNKVFYYELKGFTTSQNDFKYTYK